MGVSCQICSKHSKLVVQKIEVGMKIVGNRVYLNTHNIC